jgi:hypothetical protein
MNIDLQQADKLRLNFKHMYSDGDKHPLNDQALAKLEKLNAGCLHRRELADLGPHETERRKLTLDLIGLEHPHLWTLFET